MRAVVQRVAWAKVQVDREVIGAIGPGVLALIGVRHGDGTPDVAWLAEKLAHLRIFEDDAGKMNHSVLDARGEALVVSQFTLYGDARKGRRPNFVDAAPPPVAEALIDDLITALRAHGVPTVSGRFGAHMAVLLENDGPVTIILDTPSGGTAGPAEPARQAGAA
ncbi:MAG: D-aminoacyl-tRNA deacylase [Chloroflexota bacterium]